jgi:hypothetical protein
MGAPPPRRIAASEASGADVEPLFSQGEGSAMTTASFLRDGPWSKKTSESAAKEPTLLYGSREKAALIRERAKLNPR